MLVLVILNNKGSNARFWDKNPSFFGNLYKIYTFFKENCNKLIFAILSFIIVMSFFKFLVSLGINIENIKNFNYINLYIVISSLFPTLYIFHCLNEIPKLFQLPVWECRIKFKGNKLVYYLTGRLIYPKGKADFSIANLNYSIFQLLAMTLAFSLFQGYIKPFIFNMINVVCSVVSIRISNIWEGYIKYNNSINRRNMHFNTYLKPLELKNKEFFANRLHKDRKVGFSAFIKLNSRLSGVKGS
jgi:hypothetical protein